MRKYLNKIFNINNDSISKLGKLSDFSFEELSIKLTTLYPEFEIKKIQHDIDAFSALFITLDFKLTILYTNDGKFVSVMSKTIL